ncbi:MAG: hypothetical protein K0U40_01405 [Betaproteobacteria bacterium]|nr:hypothetical protein [Betaproteobacteria bacterium]
MSGFFLRPKLRAIPPSITSSETTTKELIHDKTPQSTHSRTESRQVHRKSRRRSIPLVDHRSLNSEHGVSL